MLSIIIVNYNSLENLNDCLRSVSEKIDFSKCEIIVVNNETSPIDASLFSFPIKIIENGKNLGFGAACNIGAKNATEELLFFLNPDTQIISGDINEVLKKFQNNPSIGIIAPKILTQDGSIQTWSFGKEITLPGLLKNNLLSEKPTVVETETEADWVSGAAFFIKKALFEKIGGFDEKFFMYFEDIDLCKRARQHSFRIMIHPDFKIMHIGGKSFDDKKTQKKYYFRSQDYYFQKHFGLLQFLILKLLRLFH